MKLKTKATGTVDEPPDFGEGGKEHRKSVIATAALVLVLLMASSLEPELFGVKVSSRVLWSCLGVAHMYFFVMWRLTAPIEDDRDKRFWNLWGLWKQAWLGGTRGFPGKTKAQILLIRSLPIWAFVIGFVGIAYGLWFWW